MNASFKLGEHVSMRSGPIRYVGRTAEIVATRNEKGRKLFGLDYSPRRKELYFTSASNLKRVS